MKIKHDGGWIKYTDDVGDYIDLGPYFSKHKHLYKIGLDDFYNDSLTFEQLKLFSEFLSEYVKNEENNS